MNSYASMSELKPIKSKTKIEVDTPWNRKTYDPSTAQGRRHIASKVDKVEKQLKENLVLDKETIALYEWIKSRSEAYEKQQKSADSALKALESLKKTKGKDEEALKTLAKLKKEKDDQERTLKAIELLEKLQEEQEQEGGDRREEGTGGEAEEEEGEDSDEDQGSTTPVNNPPGAGAPSSVGNTPPGSSPPSPPPPSPPASPDDSDDDTMPGKPRGNEMQNIPLFDGTTPDPERWLDAVERVAKTFDWEEDRWAHAAVVRMDSKASVWIESLTRMGTLDDNMKDYKTFKERFLARFKPLDEAIKATEAIMDLKMKGGETVSEFADRICLAIEKKNTSWTETQRATKEYKDSRERDQFSFMCAGLDQVLRKVVMGGSDPPTTFEDLKKKAIQAESALKAKHSIQELVEGMDKVSAESNEKEKKNDDPQTAKIEALEKQIEALKEGIKCYYCAEFGHTKRFCPKLKKDQASGNQRQGRGGARGGGNRGTGYNRGSNWRGGFRGNRGGNWRGGRGGGGRGRGYTPQAYFGQHGYYNQGYPRYPHIQQIQGNQGQQGFNQGYQPQPRQEYPNQSQHQQYEIVQMPGNF